MIRKLVFIAPIALLGLAACDGGPSTLTKAQPGECYAVTGAKPNGEPVWAKTACATDQAASTVVAGSPSATSPATTPTCPTPVVCPTVASSTATTRTQRIVVRRSEGRAAAKTRHRAERPAAREYARVPQDDYAAPSQGLMGGRDRDRSRGDRLEQRDQYAYSYRSGPQPYQPLPPLPPVERYEKRDHAYSYGERGDRLPPAPPAPPLPPPPPSFDGHAGGYDGHSYSEGYASRDTRRGPPSGYRGEQRRGHSEGYSSREERSYSSGSSSSSSSYGHGESDRGPCCETARGNMAPMNGPHFPIDADGFLTWRGKTPGN